MPKLGEFPKAFYWATWVLIWCLPPAVLARGLQRKDRLVVAAGAVTVALALVTNKPYLGWQRHTWDPILLGVLLIGCALFIRRWLARAPNGIRRGFTAQRLSGADKQWIDAGASVLGVVTPHAVLNSQAGSADSHFHGGDFGGGGASSNF